MAIFPHMRIKCLRVKNTYSNIKLTISQESSLHLFSFDCKCSHFAKPYVIYPAMKSYKHSVSTRGYISRKCVYSCAWIKYPEIINPQVVFKMQEAKMLIIKYATCYINSCFGGQDPNNSRKRLTFPKVRIAPSEDQRCLH